MPTPNPPHSLRAVVLIERQWHEHDDQPRSQPEQRGAAQVADQRANEDEQNAHLPASLVRIVRARLRLLTAATKNNLAGQHTHRRALLTVLLPTLLHQIPQDRDLRALLQQTRKRLSAVA